MLWRKATDFFPTVTLCLFVDEPSKKLYGGGLFRPRVLKVLLYVLSLKSLDPFKKVLKKQTEIVDNAKQNKEVLGSYAPLLTKK